MSSRLGIDVGGTFTDLLLFDERSGAMRLLKTPSTPSDHKSASRPFMAQGMQLATSRRKIDAFSIVVNSAWQRKTRRGNRRGVPRSMCRGD
jgi:N-methylhydantoinase A/oxoprolinase/acetone carboxylase beta subunit